MKWFSDQSRFIAGFECPWRRLIRYHWMGTGAVAKVTPEDIEIGTRVHTKLELAYNHLKSTGNLLGRADLEQLDGPKPVYTISSALAHAYVRAILPWIAEHYEVLAVEEEHTKELDDEIVWMARGDLTLRSKATGKVWGADFKTTGSKPEKIGAIHISSLQTIMNGWLASAKHGELGGFQIHVLNRGSEDYPSFLTHAYYRAGQFGSPDDWQPKPRRKDGSWLGKLYRKVKVGEFRPVPEWIWEMPIENLQEAVPVMQADYWEPLDLRLELGLKILQARASIIEHEKWWIEKISKIDWDSVSLSELDNQIPRTFRCQQYGKTCEYMNICFNREGLIKPQDLLKSGRGYEKRSPHHPQEGSFDD